MNQGKGAPVERYYETLESWDMEFGKVYIHGRGLRMVGENSFLWAGLAAKSEIRELLDELYEQALEGEPGSWERLRVFEGAASRR